MPDDIVVVDGSLEFGGGINSVKCTTVASAQSPNGLARNELAWLNNAAVRDGGISPRGGWQFLCRPHDGSAFYQGGWMYEPVDGSDPYLVCSIGGRIWKFGINDCAAEEISVTRLVQSVNPSVSSSLTLLNISGSSPAATIPAGTVLNSTPLLGTTSQNFDVPAANFSGKLFLTLDAPVIVGDYVTINVPSAGNLQFQVTAVTTQGAAPSLTGLTVQNSGGTQTLVGTTIPAGQPIDSHYPSLLLVDDFVVPALGSTAQAKLNAIWPGHLTFSWCYPSNTCSNEIVFTPVARSVPPGPPPPPPPIPPPINPESVERAYFCQAEQFLIIQAGDGVTLPLFWDGSTIRRSIGINNTAVLPGKPGVNELPAAFSMDYYQGRLWYAQGRQYSAGDIVGGNSGTAQYQKKDSILNVTENPLVLGGDGFTTPGNSGNIRAIKHNANQDSALGQGLLYIFTRKDVFSLQVPITRTAWIAATDANQPLQSVIQTGTGAVGDRSVVSVNGDLYYQSLDPAIRSMYTALRYFNQPGNRPISANEQRILQYCDRSLMHFCSGIEFDNRLLMSSLPKRLTNGVVSQAIIPLDFIPISSFNADSSPVWEGMYEGLDFLQLFTGNFNGVQRAFGLVASRKDQGFEIWEITQTGGLRSDLNATGENRITWTIEFPAFTWDHEFLLKRLVSAELWVDRMFGTVDFELEFRGDGDPCWHPWAKWKSCSARNCTESVYNPCDYPSSTFGETYRSTMTIPKPPSGCASVMGRPADILYQCQTRLTIKGFCRIRGELLKAYPVERKLWSNNVV